MSRIKTSKGWFPYTTKLLYLGIKRIDKNIAFENFKLLSEILKKLDIALFPAFGTMIGIVREHDFIDWDEDIDLSIKGEDEEKFKDALWTLREHGFELIRYERRGLYSVMRKGEYIDFYVWQKVSENLRFNSTAYMFDRYFNELTDIDFKGIKVAVPKDYDQYLTIQYGDWRTPVQYADFEMTSFKKMLLKITCWIKNNMPGRWYYKAMLKQHESHYKKLLKRCGELGLMSEVDATYDDIKQQFMKYQQK